MLNSMTIERLQNVMFIELDWIVRDYLKYTDEGMKRKMINEYRTTVSIYNMLLLHLFGDEAIMKNAFPITIDEYIQMRIDDYGLKPYDFYLKDLQT